MCNILNIHISSTAMKLQARQDEEAICYSGVILHKDKSCMHSEMWHTKSSALDPGSKILQAGCSVSIEETVFPIPNHAGTAQISSLLLMPEAATSGSLRASSKKLQQWGIGQGNGTYKSLSHCAAHHTLVKAIAIVPHISSHLHTCNFSDILHSPLHSAFVQYPHNRRLGATIIGVICQAQS